MISDVALARAAFAQSRTPADALLAIARADLKLDSAPLDAAQTALKTEGPADIVAAEQQVLDSLQTNAAPETVTPRLDKTA